VLWLQIWKRLIIKNRETLKYNIGICSPFECKEGKILMTPDKKEKKAKYFGQKSMKQIQHLADEPRK
jgi:hypothetical protein